jgi:hypothetical protein
MAGIEDIPSFIFGGTSGTPSYDELLRRRQVAVANAMRARKAPTTFGEGLTYLGEAVGDRIEGNRLSKLETLLAAKEAADRKAVPGGSYVTGGGGGATVAPAPAPGAAVPFSGAGAGNLSGVGVRDRIAALVQDQQDGTDAPQEVAQANPTWAVAEAPPDTASASPGGQSPDILERRRNAIGGIETGGTRDPYTTVVDTGRGDSVYGRYGIKGSNIPEWTQAALGQRLTPRDFLNSKEAQDTVFDHRFGQYANKYGDEGAARAWYAGEGGMNNPNATDRFGQLNVASYGQNYLNRLGEGSSVNPVLARRIAAEPPSNAGSYVAPDIARKIQTASLGAAGGTMSDALPPEAASLAALSEPVATPATLAPAPEENPPTPTDIKPMPVRTQLAQAGPGLIPGSVAGLPGLPAAGVLGPPPPATAGAAPAMPPSRATIPPASPQGLPDDPGAAPARPSPMGPSQPQRYWEQFIDNPHVSPQMQAYAKRQWDQEELYRRSLNDAQNNAYIDQRERWQKLTDERNKLIREAPTFDIKQLKDRLDIEKAQFDAQAAPLDYQIKEATLAAKPEELKKLITERKNLEVEYHQKIRNLYKPDEVTAGGTQFQRPYDPTVAPGAAQPGRFSVPAGLPQPKDPLTGEQAKTIKFFQRATVASSQVGDSSVLAGFKDTAAGKVPLTGNYWVSPEYQRAQSAAMTWLLSVLRDESGAAIGLKEAADKYHQYFPLPGDSEQVIRDKNFRRRAEEQSLYHSLGDAKPQIDKWLEERKTRKVENNPTTGLPYPEGTERTNKTTGVKQRVMGGHWENEEDLR